MVHVILRRVIILRHIYDVNVRTSMEVILAGIFLLVVPLKLVGCSPILFNASKLLLTLHAFGCLYWVFSANRNVLN